MTLGQVKSVQNVCLFGPQRAERRNILRIKKRKPKFEFRTLIINHTECNVYRVLELIKC